MFSDKSYSKVFFGFQLCLVAIVIQGGAAGVAWAGDGQTAPEIDPGSARGALAFLAGAVALAVQRLRR